MTSPQPIVDKAGAAQLSVSTMASTMTVTQREGRRPALDYGKGRYRNLRIKYIGTANVRGDSSLMNELRQAYPAGLQGVHFRFELFDDDPALSHILQALQNADVPPRNRLAASEDHKRHYLLRLERTYSEADLSASALLVIRPRIMLYRMPMPDGTPAVDNGLGATRLNAWYDMALASGHFLIVPGGDFLVVSDSFKDAVQKENLNGPVFTPLTLNEPRPENWWVMSTTKRLPPVSPSMAVYDAQDNDVGQFSDKPGEFCYLSESRSPPGCFFDASHQELSYLESEMAAGEPFDIASTYEAIGTPDRRDFVVSQRFYELCKARGVKADWGIVRLVDGVRS